MNAEEKEFRKKRRQFRQAVLQGPPWFLAVLIILAVCILCTRFVFSVHHRRPGGELSVNIQGWIEGGGGDESPGGDDNDTEEAAEQLDPDTDFADEIPSFQPLRRLERVSRVGPIGTRGSSAKKTADRSSSRPAVTVKKRTGGGSGSGRGLGRGKGSPWGNRTGSGRKFGVAKFGGTGASETAVELGLDWLRRHQSPTGAWDGDGYHKICGSSSCGKSILCMDCDTGLTGLSLMAFLGAGYTHRSGRHQRTVSKGIRYLLSMLDDRGCFCERRNLRCLYNQSLAVIALAEAFGLTRDETLKSPLRRGVTFLLRTQQPGGGWTYTPNPVRQRNDSSITGFAIMAIKAAREAGMDLGDYALARARRHFDRMTQKRGDVIYADTGTRAGDRGGGMLAVGLFSAYLLGRPHDHPMTRIQLARLRALPPKWNVGPGKGSGDRTERKRYMSISNSMYYWYYATLAMFCAGGDSWAWWNPRIRDLLVGRQVRSGCAAGSWDPQALWAEDVGRIYSTALNVLTLEIYYRYTPGFLTHLEEEGWDLGQDEERRRKDDDEPERQENEEERLRRLRDLLKKRRKNG